MKFVSYNEELYDSFIKFNQFVYPEREDVKKSFQKRILDNPLIKDKKTPNIILALNDNNEVVGQFLLSPVEVYYQNKIIPGNLGSDFIVEDKYKDTGIGALLALRAIRSFKPYFALGLTKIAREIHLSCNSKIIGCSYKFLYLRKRLHTAAKAIKGFINKNKFQKNKFIHDFPDFINSKDFTFIKINTLVDFNYDYFGENLIQFEHSSSFLNWRFFSTNGIYAMYVLKANPTIYFIVRKCFWRGLVLLFILDYHFSLEKEPTLINIFKASKLLVKICNFDGVITTSSLNMVDRQLESQSFKKINTPIWILSSSEIFVDKKSIEKRNSVFITPVDSDYEFNFDNIS